MALGTPLWTVLAATAGLAAAALGRIMLGRLRRGAAAPPPSCELIVAACWAIAVTQAGRGAFPVWWLPVPLGVAWFAVLLAAVDLRHHRLPDALTLPAYPMIAVFLLVNVVAGDGPGPGVGMSLRAVLGGLALGGSYALAHLCAPGALGGGDVKLAGALGAVLAAASWPALLLGPIVAAALTLLLAALRRRRLVPHGPGMLAATWILTTFPVTGVLAPG